MSGRAILVRLLRSNKIPQQSYRDYVDFQDKKYSTEESRAKLSGSSAPRAYRHREPLNVFGKPFVYAVFDSLYSKNITLAKASTYLDNLKISDLRKLEHYV